MDIRSIRKLIEIIDQSDIAEIEIKDGEGNIRITRNKAPIMMAAAPTMQVAPAASVAPTAAAPTEPVVAAAPVVTGHEIKSPMVGTYYNSSSPDSPMFVKEGDIVSEGDTLCIIEAMKIMNPIESDKSGKVIKILASNSTPVQYGQTLFIIE